MQALKSIKLEVGKENPELGMIRIVNEYLKVFPKDLPSLPPHREIKFSIDLVPVTQPISIPLYKMAPVEMRELKDQL